MEKEQIQISNKELTGKDRLFEIINVLKNNNILSGMNPQKFKKILEELGPTFIKIGQILSNRPDMLSEEYIKELSQLRSDTIPLSYQEILDILNEEYDKKLFEIFLNIDRKELGSASIAQVHKATLIDGTKVVIKVQRPNIKEKMTTDIRLLKKAMKMLHVQSFVKNIIDLDSSLDELLKTTLEEINFLTEASHIDEFYKNNKEYKYIKVPKVYKNLTTEHVLVMEYIDGYKISNTDKLIEEGYDLDEIGSKLADNYINQAITEGYFHADPHPDNIIITDGKIAFIDFGMMGRLSNKNRELLEKCIYAILVDDVKEVEKILLILGDTTSDINHQKLRNEIKKILDKYKTTGIKEINITKFANEMLNMLGDNKIVLPEDITMLVRGIVVLEGTLEVVSPNINLLEVFKARVKKVDLKKIISKDKLSTLALNTLTSANDLIKLPEDLHRFLKETSEGETKFCIEVNDSNKKIDRFEKMVHRIVVCLLDIGFIVGAALIASNGVTTSEQKFIFYLYLFVGTIFTIWLFIKMYIDKLNRK